MKESVSSLFFLLILFLLSSPPFIIIHPLHPHAPPPPLSSTPLHVILSPLQKMVRLLQFVENSPPVTTIMLLFSHCLCTGDLRRERRRAYLSGRFNQYRMRCYTEISLDRRFNDMGRTPRPSRANSAPSLCFFAARRYSWLFCYTVCL